MKRLVIASAFFLLPAAYCADSGEDELRIGKRSTTASTTAPRIWFAKNASEAVLHKDAIDGALLLAKPDPSKPEYTSFQQALKSDPERIGKLYAPMLNPKKYESPAVRLGALKVIETSGAKAPQIGHALAYSAMLEPVEDVRKLTIATIRSRKDGTATASLLKLWKDAFADEAMGVQEEQRRVAVRALREVGDKRVYQALYSLATVELRTGTASLDRIDTVNIRNAGLPVTGDAPGATINLPIDLPSINTMWFEGTVMVPAFSALREITGQEFGRNLPKWNEWIAQQPEFRE